MPFSNFFKNLFNYTTDSRYSYELSQTQIQNNISPKETTQTVSKSLHENLEFLTVTYNILINSDINIRNFKLNAKGKQYNAALIYIDGMVNSEILNHYVLKPLMLENQSNTDTQSKTIIVNKNKELNLHTIKNPNLEDLILNSLIPQNTIQTEKKFSDILAKINNGFTCLLVDTLDTAFCIEAKGFKSREISAPENEIVVRGSQEAFVENIRTNTSIIRRIVNNENLIIEQTAVGKIV